MSTDIASDATALAQPVAADVRSRIDDTAPPPRHLVDLVRGLGPFAFIAVLGFLAWRAYERAVLAVTPADPSPFDGTFQLLNALRRLTSGSRLGSDYVVFHGPLWELPHLPAFVISDHSLLAVEASKYFVNQLVLPITAGVAVLLLAGRSRVRWWAAILVLLLTTLYIEPGQLADMSSLGQRVSAGIMLITAAAFAMTTRPKALFAVAVAVSGLAMALSIDQGLWALAGSAVTIALIAAHKPLRRALRLTPWRAIGVVFGPPAVLGLLIFAAAGFSVSSTITAIRFYFSDMPRDQRWFFGSWPATSVQSWDTLLTDHLPAVILLVAAVAVTVWGASRLTQRASVPASARRSEIAIMIFGLYAAFSLLTYFGGIAASHYLVSAQVGIFCALGVGLADVERMTHPTDASSKPMRARRGRTALGALACVAIVATTFSVVPAKIASADEARLSDRWVAYEQAVADAGVQCSADGDQLWSSYPSIVQYRGDCFTPAGDLMIHALGTRRDEYVDAFHSSIPRFVETARHDANPWEPWLRSSNWDFYQHLWTWYSPIAHTDHSLLWIRNEQPDLWLFEPKAHEAVSVSEDGRAAIAPPADGSWLGLVNVKYDASQPLRWVPIIGRQSQFAISLTGTLPAGEQVTLNPARRKQSFPIQWSGESGEIGLEFARYGLAPFDSLTVFEVDVTWYQRPTDPKASWPDAFTIGW